VMRGLPGDSESGKNPIMPNNRVNLTAGSSVALDAASSVAAAGYPWRL
jgi:hypothetical protein